MGAPKDQARRLNIYDFSLSLMGVADLKEIQELRPEPIYNNWPLRRDNRSNFLSRCLVMATIEHILPTRWSGVHVPHLGDRP